MGLFNERKTMAGQPFMRLSRCGAKSAKTRHASAALSLVGDDAQSWRRSEKVNALPKKSADLAEGAKNGLQRRQALRRSCYVTTRPGSGSVGAVGWAWRVREYRLATPVQRSALSAWLWAIAGVLRGIQCARRGPVRGGEHGDPRLCSGYRPRPTLQSDPPVDNAPFLVCGFPVNSLATAAALARHPSFKGIREEVEAGV
jgi:hypothetical protein